MTSTLHSAADLAAAVRDSRPDAIALGIEITTDWCREQMHDLGITRYEDVDAEIVSALDCLNSCQTWGRCWPPFRPFSSPSSKDQPPWMSAI
jgi:hypothetical protein